MLLPDGVEFGTVFAPPHDFSRNRVQLPPARAIACQDSSADVNPENGSMSGRSEVAPALDDGFVAGLLAAQGRLYRYVVSLVPARADAEDLIQKTLLTAWQ